VVLKKLQENQNQHYKKKTIISTNEHNIPLSKTRHVHL